MTIRHLYFLLIRSIVLSVIFVACNKDGDSSYSSPITFTDNRDNKTYKFVKIGDQIWMAENLAYTGIDIQYITHPTEWFNNDNNDGWCYYNNNEDNGKTYGILYQWEAAKRACPKGWHLPTDDEWSILINFLEANGYSCDSEIGGTKVAKSLATDSGWNISEEKYSVGNIDYSEFKNKTNFSALPSGVRFNNGEFYGLNFISQWWSATEYNGIYAHYRYLKYDCAEVYREHFNKSGGFPVRCIKD